jgi:hypothetical protein
MRSAEPSMTPVTRRSGEANSPMPLRCLKSWRQWKDSVQPVRAELLRGPVRSKAGSGHMSSTKDVRGASSPQGIFPLAPTTYDHDRNWYSLGLSHQRSCR